MKHLPLACALLLALLPRARAGDKATTEMFRLEPLEKAPWQFNMGMPSWLAGIEGQAGVGGRTVDVDVSADKILRHLNFTAAFNAEVRKGPLGFYADFLYLDERAGTSTRGLVSSLALRVDEYLADAEVNWRLIERPWGWVEIRAGARYINLYQQLGLSPDSGAIENASRELTTAPEGAVRAVLERNLRGVLNGNNPALPVPPLGYEQKQKLIEVIQRIKENPAAAEVVQRKIARALERGLSRTFALGKDWADPYIGLAARYDFCLPYYFTAKADAGGFGVGSRLTWQGYAALGYQITHQFYAEAGYRCLYVDYRDGGFVYDVATCGAQVTVGMVF